jgi:4-deoxy-L-threo-5-hexosulose-uronate ketol-isomerase
MEVRNAPNALAAQRMTTEELRSNFLIETLFVDNAVSLVYSDVDRAIVGGIVPAGQPLELLASKKEMAAEYFCERREAGIINIGGKGSIDVDGKRYPMEMKDVLYIGKGSKKVTMTSESKENPARYYLMSYPAHKEYPTAHAKFSEAEPQRLGNQNDANKRTIYKYIHLNGIKSCQLVMGMTELDEGSVWNTMPAHTHIRRSEVYMYFNIKENAAVFHLMGEPAHSRNMIVHNGQAVISPSWSIHCGAGTSNYSFVWAMGGENQEFNDMDGIAIKDLR